jgi:hypothetical protein
MSTPTAPRADSATEAIMRLVFQFPCLRAKLRTAPPDFFMGGFNPEKFRQLVGHDTFGTSCSVIEQECVCFVLCSWDAHYTGHPMSRFDLFNFLTVADPAHKAVVANWITNPLFKR